MGICVATISSMQHKRKTRLAPGESQLPAQRRKDNKHYLQLIVNWERQKMERIPAALLLAVALCTVSCFCAPITTPPPPAPTPAPVNEGAKESSSSLADVENVMMDPSAKLRKFCDNRAWYCLSKKYLQAQVASGQSSIPLSCNHAMIACIVLYSFCSLAEAGGWHHLPHW